MTLSPAVCVPQIWDLMQQFKEYCIAKNWNVYHDGDIVEALNNYHKFLWVRSLTVTTFKNIVLNAVCALCRLVKPSYLAWVLPEPPSEDIWLYLITDAPRLSKRIALYDLSRVYNGADTFLGLNETSSMVFQEFERFLREKYGLRYEPLTQLQSKGSLMNRRTTSNSITIL